MHQWPFFPGTGAADELGAGDGRHTNLNLPLGDGRDGQVAVPVWQRGLDAVVEFDPQLVLFEAGFDAHAADWTSDIHLSDADFGRLGERTGAALRAIGCPAVFELGGGYTQPAVTGGLRAFLAGLTATWSGECP
jgi:acetoin utilization deacetylase AcuC-like enzyme